MSHLHEPHLRALAQVCVPRRYNALDEIAHQGENEEHFFIVDEGSVHFRKTDKEGFETPAGIAGPGEFFGKKMFTTMEPFEYSADAYTDVVVYALSREDFDRLIQDQPEILHAMPEIAAKRHQMTRGFSWLVPGETVALTTHRHPWALFISLVPNLLALTLLVAIIVALSFLKLLSDSPVIVAPLAFAALLLLGWTAWVVQDWANDDFIVTNKRVAHAERKLLLQEARDAVPLNKIQAMTVTKGGPLEVALGIATLQVRSAGRDSSCVTFDRVANTERIRKEIFTQQAKLQAQQQAADRQKFRRRVGNELRHYVLHEPPIQPAPEPPKPRRRRRDWARELWQHLFASEIREGNIVTWRKHPIVLLEKSASSLLLLLVVLGLAVGISLVPLPSFLSRFPLYAVAFVLLLAIFVRLLWRYEDWRNDLYRLTQNEIIDIDRLPFGLNETSAVTLFNKVQDVKMEQPRFLNQLFDFGDVKIQVAGGGTPLTFEQVPHPKEIMDEIFRRIDAQEERKRESESKKQSALVVDALVAYHKVMLDARTGGTPIGGNGNPATTSAGAAAPNNAPTQTPPGLASGQPQLMASAQSPQAQPVPAPNRAGIRAVAPPAEFPPPQVYDDLEE